MDLNNIKALPKYFEYSGKQSAYILYNFTNTIFLSLVCKNAPMNSNWWTLALFLVSSSEKYKCQMSIYYKYATDGINIGVLSFVDDCVNWYTSEALGKCFVDILGKRFHVNFLVYAH